MSEANDTLLRCAEAVADGEPVDWKGASASGEVLAPRLKRLEILAAIAGACGMPSVPPRPNPDVLFRWCHLEIRERIGEGAYGEVYRAWDPKLEREVAVKFLRAEALAAEHTLQEGRHLARVRHPGVVMVFGAEEMDGRVGIWMEHVRGHTLESLLEERGRFSSHEAILIGIDLCRALAAVHRAGLVHRDVKSRNVVRDDSGRIVLMDFGAGVDARSGNSDLQGLAGTPIYLAPEVLEGQSASPQSDLYGLGVLLYRLVTHGYPIAGATLDALRVAHARGEKRTLSEVRPDLPAPFVRVVERALATDPSRRFASAEQMEIALAAALDQPRRIARRRAGIVTAAAGTLLVVGLTVAAQRTGAPPAPASGRPPIAVADVVNQAGDPEFDALASMLVTSLEQARGLLVLTRSQMTDVLAVAGKPTTARIDRALGLEAGRRASVTALLVPSIRRQGGGYRVSLDAVDPRRGRTLFAASTFAAGKDGLSAAIDSLSKRVRAALEPGAPVGRTPLRPVAQITTASLGAYHHYDLAERLIDRVEMAGARTELEQAVALDSTFGLAHARLAYVCWWLNDQDSERRQLARAFALIDRVPERHRYQLRAQGAMADREGLEAARSILLEMERFYPQDKEMLYDIGDYSSHLSEFPTAVQYLERVAALDPGCGRALQHLARVYRDMGRRAEFLQWARRYARADSVWDTYVLLGNALIATGDTSGGIDVLARGRAVRPEGHDHDFGVFIAKTRFLQGRFADGLREWEAMLRAPLDPATRAGLLRERARARVQQGAYREALADLARAVELRRGETHPVEQAMFRLDAAFVLRLGRHDNAAAFRALGHDPRLETGITYRDTYFNHWEYWGGLFKLHLLDGRIDAAAALARRKFATDKWYGPYVAAYLHAARGECAQAAAAASRVLEWGPASENIPLLYFIARCQLGHGEPDAAIASLLRLQAFHSNMTLGTPFYAGSFMLLGEAHERKGERVAAARSYAQLLDLWREGDPDLADRLEARRRLDRLQPALAAR